MKRFLIAVPVLLGASLMMGCSKTQSWETVHGSLKSGSGKFTVLMPSPVRHDGTDDWRSSPAEASYSVLIPPPLPGSGHDAAKMVRQEIDLLTGNKTGEHILAEHDLTLSGAKAGKEIMVQDMDGKGHVFTESWIRCYSDGYRPYVLMVTMDPLNGGEWPADAHKFMDSFRLQGSSQSASR